VRIVDAIPLSEVIAGVSLNDPLDAVKSTGVPTTIVPNASSTRAVTVAVPPFAPVGTTAFSSRREGVPFAGDDDDVGFVGVSKAQRAQETATASTNRNRMGMMRRSIDGLVTSLLTRLHRKSNISVAITGW